MDHKRRSGRRELFTGIGLLAAFGIWTMLIQLVDVQAAGPEGTKIGLAAFNVWFHQLTGQNMFMKTIIEADDGRTIPVLTMGLIGITPELKRKGYGKALLDYSLEKAAELGYGAVLFEGNIDFYGKSGFDYARLFGIRYHDLPEGADDSFFLCKELIPGYLDSITGVYQTPQGYYVDDSDVEELDRGFPPKVKQKLPGQIFG